MKKKIIMCLFLLTGFGLMKAQVKDSDKKPTEDISRLFNVKVGYLLEHSNDKWSEFGMDNKNFFVGLEQKYKFKAGDVMFLQSYNFMYKSIPNDMLTAFSTEFITRYKSSIFHADLGFGAGIYRNRIKRNYLTYLFEDEYQPTQVLKTGFTLNTYIGVGMDFKQFTPFIDYSATSFIPFNRNDPSDNRQLRIGLQYRF